MSFMYCGGLHCMTRDKRSAVSCRAMPAQYYREQANGNVSILTVWLLFIVLLDVYLKEKLEIGW